MGFPEMSWEGRNEEHVCPIKLLFFRHNKSLSESFKFPWTLPKLLLLFHRQFEQCFIPLFTLSTNELLTPWFLNCRTFINYKTPIINYSSYSTSMGFTHYIWYIPGRNPSVCMHGATFLVQHPWNLQKATFACRLLVFVAALKMMREWMWREGVDQVADSVMGCGWGLPLPALERMGPG